jgi:hypothetical protein
MMMGMLLKARSSVEEWLSQSGTVCHPPHPENPLDSHSAVWHGPCWVCPARQYDGAQNRGMVGGLGTVGGMRW